MKRVRLIQPVKHAGRRHLPGVELEMADAAAAELSAIAAVQILGDVDGGGTGDAGPPAPTANADNPDLIAITGGTPAAEGGSLTGGEGGSAAGDAPIGEPTVTPPAVKPTAKPARKAPAKKR